MTSAARWGLCATVKAPAADVLRFAAFHLSAGAHRIHICLDAPNPGAFAALKAHPKCRVTQCDDAYWQQVKGHRPAKHQIRQSFNATRTYRRVRDVDWLIHMDVDEFLVSELPVASALAALPQNIQSARTRPMEALAPSDAATFPDAFKKFLPNGPARLETAMRLYPTFGAYVKGGFVSHVAGKLFVRTGLPDMKIRIHNAQQNEQMNPRSTELDQVALAHCHASNWQAWRDAYQYRFEKGSYRANLAPAIPEADGGLTLHALFKTIRAHEGEHGLRTFFDEVCADTPEHRSRLEKEQLLVVHDLALETHLKTHFPDFTNG
ncbi:glycosyltransferase family 2 protein [Roseobacter sp. YSTF-M11]|uniref:Glycosyltransferase family 2 protein n=1 Tax=Roseobacter insulae TaxID=2859783 RepID=A0A9X1FU47_9RHOB|nr:glycosyltransferase family 2 protein [Roseobacter insulae]MBW4707930.1 glycosyltransferase family 2 protein [Roseobacter insulae]